jgi:hypothetical protein
LHSVNTVIHAASTDGRKELKMTYPTELSKFPAEFEQIALRAYTLRKPLLLRFPDAKHTRRFRSRFYAYLRLVRATNINNTLALAAASVTLTLADDHLSCTIGVTEVMQGLSVEVQVLRGVLGAGSGEVTGAAVVPAQEALRAKLAEIRSRKGKVED